MFEIIGDTGAEVLVLGGNEDSSPTSSEVAGSGDYLVVSGYYPGDIISLSVMQVFKEGIAVELPNSTISFSYEKIQISLDGSTIVALQHGNELHTYALDDDFEVKYQLKHAFVKQGDITSTALSDDGQYLFVGSGSTCETYEFIESGWKLVHTDNYPVTVSDLVCRKNTLVIGKNGSGYQIKKLQKN